MMTEREWWEDDPQLASVLSGSKAILTKLRAGDIRFDPIYQRTVSRSKMEGMAHGWDWAGEGVILVNRRASGDLYGMDGQHRVLAKIHRFGEDVTIDCKVYDALTIAQEARVFAIVNTRRGPVKTGERYRALWEAGDAEVLAIIEILDRLEIPHSWFRSAEEYKIACWAAMHGIVRQQGADQFRRVMELVNESWRGQYMAIEADFIQGFALLVRNHSGDPGWDDTEIREFFRRVPASEIDMMAREHRNAQTTDKPSPSWCRYWAFWKTYNKRRRTRSLSDLKMGKGK